MPILSAAATDSRIHSQFELNLVRFQTVCHVGFCDYATFIARVYCFMSIFSNCIQSIQSNSICWFDFRFPIVFIACIQVIFFGRMSVHERILNNPLEIFFPNTKHKRNLRHAQK